MNVHKILTKILPNKNSRSFETYQYKADSDFYHMCKQVKISMKWLLRPQNFLGKNTGMGSHSLLHGIFPTQGSNLGLLLPPGKPMAQMVKNLPAVWETRI